MASIDDSALLRLAASKGEDGTAFLQPHHLAASLKLGTLIEKARMTPRVTMSYDPSRIGGGTSGGNGVSEASDSAASARQQLSRIASLLPPDCWSVAFDVCGMGKGLQVIETERRWPRRSAKLVLRIGLDQLATHFGLAPHMAGHHGQATRGWLEARPAMFDAAS